MFNINWIARYVLSHLRDSMPYTQDGCQSAISLLTRSIMDSWNCVSSLLCNEAPEGFMLEDIEDDFNVTTKDLVSYGWRALRESR